MLNAAAATEPECECVCVQSYTDRAAAAGVADEHKARLRRCKLDRISSKPLLLLLQDVVSQGCKIGRHLRPLQGGEQIVIKVSLALFHDFFGNSG